MSDNLPAVQDQQQAQPFARMMQANTGANVGAIEIESQRAIAEAQGQLTLAKKFPRSMTAATQDFLDACNSPEFAATAFYSVPNRGSGPSIRLAEEAARCYGNFIYGHRELSRTEGKSEIEVYAWDMEKNNRSSRQITVMHVTDTKNGPKRLTDQADIDNKIANVASKQMRGRILALMPKSMIAQGVAAAKRALAGGGEKPVGERIIAMAQAFARYGVSRAHLETHLGHNIDHTTIDELADLMGTFNAIKEGAKASEFFPMGDAPDPEAASAAAAVAAQAKAGASATPAPAPAARRTASKPAQADGNAPKEQAGESAQKPTQQQAEAPAQAAAPAAETKAAAPAPAPAATPPAAAPAAPAGDAVDDVF